MKGKQVNRRQFLRKATGTALGAISFPYVIPSSVFGRNGRVAPSERLVMGCIGAGWQGRGGMAGGAYSPKGGFISRAGVQVVAVCDVDTRHRNLARDIVNERYDNKDCDAYNDFRDLLARDDIDMVLIAVGDRWQLFEWS